MSATQADAEDHCKVRDLGPPLIAVIQIDPKQANEPHADANADTDHTHSTQETNA